MSTQSSQLEYFRNYPGFRIESGNRINDGELKGRPLMCLSSRMKLKDLHIIKTDIINLYANGTSMACGYKATTEDDWPRF